MFKEILIFAIGSFIYNTIKKNTNKTYWYNFSINKTTKEITIIKEKSFDNKNKFFYNFDKNNGVRYPIELNSDYGTIARIVFAESYLERGTDCLLGVAEVIRNRFYSPYYKYAAYKNFSDVVLDKKQFLGITLPKFTNTQSLIDNNSNYKDFFIRSVSVTLMAIFLNSNETNGALGFNQSKITSPWDSKDPITGQMIRRGIIVKNNCIHTFWNLKKT